jgi:hypothetical protein
VFKFRIIDAQMNALLDASGLAPVVKEIEHGDVAVTLSERLPGSALHAILATVFDPYLSSLTLEITANLQPIQSPRYAQRIAKQCAVKFVDIYRVIYAKVMDESSAYHAPRTTILVRTVDEVATLLGIQQ